MQLLRTLIISKINIWLGITNDTSLVTINLICLAFYLAMNQRMNFLKIIKHEKKAQ